MHILDSHCTVIVHTHMNFINKTHTHAVQGTIASSTAAYYGADGARQHWQGTNTTIVPPTQSVLVPQAEWGGWDAV